VELMRDYTSILQGFLSVANTALTDAGRPPGRAELTPGLRPAWDDCCDGQLYLRVIEVYPTAGQNAPFPQIDASQRGAAGGQCAIHGLAVHIGLGIIRCAATVREDGTAPSPEEVSADARLMLQDMDTLLDVLLCKAPQEEFYKGVEGLKMDRWMPQGVEGGCAGGEWGVYLWVDPCVCRPLPTDS
jgi:hypothetical protein